MESVTTMIANKKEFTKLVSSFVLGDGYLSTTKSYYLVEQRTVERPQYNRKKNSAYRLKQLKVHQDYVEWQVSILEELTSVHLVVVPQSVDSRGYNSNERYQLSTKTHPFYTAMRERLYNSGVKQLDPHYLKLFDWQSAAILYMDDGWIDVEPRLTKETYVRASIASHSYTYAENLLLKQVLKEKLGIEFNVRRHKQRSGEYKWYLEAKKDHAKRFLSGIERYVFPSFYYKLSYD